MTASALLDRPGPAPGPAGGPSTAPAEQPTDSLPLLTAYVVVLVGIPAVYVVKPLGAAGTPATILGVLAFGLWLLPHLTGSRTRRATPVHWCLAFFVGAVLLSFIAGAVRPMTGDEYSGMWRGMIALTSWAGVVLTVADGLRTRERLERLLRVLVWAGAVLGALGFLQFLTGINLVPYLHVPGLTQNSDIGGLYARSGFSRVSVTALHSIEYAAVLSMILPLGFWYALGRERGRFRHWVPVLLMGVALPLTVARSGMAGLVVALVFAFFMMRGAQRRWYLVAVPFIAVGVRLAVPGLLGTIASLFASADEDISIEGRTSDYAAVGVFFDQSPVVGRGISTFLPSIYRILDNAYLGVLIEAGIVGLVAMVVLIAGPAGLAFRTAHRVRAAQRTAAAAGRPPASTDRSDALLPFAVGAALTSALLLFATFDAFGFPMCMGVFSILLGVTGALVRDSRPAGAPRRRRPRRATVARRSLVSLVAVAAVLLPAGLAVRAASPTFDARTSFALAVPPRSGENIFYAKLDIKGVSDLVRFALDSAGTRQELTDAGAGGYTIAIGSGSLGPYTDVVGTGDVMRVSGTGDDPAAATATVQTVLDTVAARLQAWQAAPGVPAESLVQVVDQQPIEVYEISVHRPAGVVGAVLLATLAAIGACAVADRVAGRRRQGDRT